MIVLHVSFGVGLGLGLGLGDSMMSVVGVDRRARDMKHEEALMKRYVIDLR